MLHHALLDWWPVQHCFAPWPAVSQLSFFYSMMLLMPWFGLCVALLLCIWRGEFTL
jgi:hypothetical protein